MNQHELILFFVQISLMMLVALLFGHVMRKFHSPTVLGELIGGIILGPTVFGAFFPELFISLFPDKGLTSICLDAVIKLGLLFFLFSAGLEINLNLLKESSMKIVGTSASGIIIPFILGFGIVLLFPSIWSLPSGSNLWLYAMFIGTALSISALPVITRILMDINLMKHKLSIIMIASSTISDLFGWTMFVVILGSFASGSIQYKHTLFIVSLIIALFVLILSFGHWGGQKFMLWMRKNLVWPSGFIGATTIVILVAASLFETLGIHSIWGAFFIGVALATPDEKKNSAHDIVNHFAISFFSPLYFVSIGMRADFAKNFDFTLVLLVLLVACIGKILGACLGGVITGMSLRDASIVGFGMNARGAIEMILAQIALESKIINERVYVALIVMALVTTMMTAPVIQCLIKTKHKSNESHLSHHSDLNI
jgi:Kef-type K+ transport system membrane component KefB